MIKAYKENLEKKELTDAMIISCLVTCESVISKNAYLEKKWSNSCPVERNTYCYERLKWMKYREKLQSLLLPIYSMKLIIQLTKSCTDKVSQKTVEDVIVLVDNNDYTLV